MDTAGRADTAITADSRAPPGSWRSSSGRAVSNRRSVRPNRPAAERSRSTSSSSESATEPIELLRPVGEGRPDPVAPVDVDVLDAGRRPPAPGAGPARTVRRGRTGPAPAPPPARPGVPSRRHRLAASASRWRKARWRANSRRSSRVEADAPSPGEVLGHPAADGGGQRLASPAHDLRDATAFVGRRRPGRIGPGSSRGDADCRVRRPRDKRSSAISVSFGQSAGDDGGPAARSRRPLAGRRPAPEDPLATAAARGSKGMSPSARIPVNSADFRAVACPRPDDHDSESPPRDLCQPRRMGAGVQCAARRRR